MKCYEIVKFIRLKNKNEQKIKNYLPIPKKLYKIYKIYNIEKDIYRKISKRLNYK